MNYRAICSFKVPTFDEHGEENGYKTIEEGSVWTLVPARDGYERLLENDETEWIGLPKDRFKEWFELVPKHEERS